MKATHTPGPWLVHPIVSETNIETVFYKVNANGKGILSTYLAKEEDEANIKLAAAAPEILDACADLISELNNVTVEFPEHTHEILNRIEALIKPFYK